MELTVLRDKMLTLLGVDSVDDMPEALMRVVMSSDERVLNDAKSTFPDLSRDWMQPIFQYYQADRKLKKQDFTPPSLAALIGRLAGKAETIVDLCAGSGALTISAWAENPQRKFELFEVDGKAIPFLLFNLVIRNMNAVVHHSDVLLGNEFAEYSVSSGKKFSTVEEISYGHESLYQQSAIQHGMGKAGDRQCSLLSL